MLIEDLRLDGLDRDDVTRLLAEVIAKAPNDAVLQLRLHGQIGESVARALRAASIRALTPATMNVEVIVPGARAR